VGVTALQYQIQQLSHYQKAPLKQFFYFKW